MSSYLSAMMSYADFNGRARRQEYWMFNLINLIIFIVLYFLIDSTDSGFLVAVLVIYYLAILIPSLAVTVRRLHDSGKSGWLILVNFIPFVGGIILLIFTCMDSEPNHNQWGPNPKAGIASGYHPQSMAEPASINMEKTTPDIQKPQQPAAKSEIYCSHCGEKTPAGRFCIRCGKELPQL